MNRLSRKKFIRFIGFGAMAVAISLTGFMLVSGHGHEHASADHVGKCNAVCVYLEDKAEPDTLTVKVGEYVQFNSNDGKKHSLSLGKGGEVHEHNGPFSSGEFKADEAWRVQFKEPGTYYFHDHFDPAINILLVVYDPL